jgi:hypothetical protein
MFVSTKQAYVFQQEIGQQQIGQHPDGKPIYTAKIGETFRLPLTESPVEAPEWIKETRLWELAMQDGTLTVYGDRTSAS